REPAPHHGPPRRGPAPNQDESACFERARTARVAPYSVGCSRARPDSCDGTNRLREIHHYCVAPSMDEREPGATYSDDRGSRRVSVPQPALSFHTATGRT